MKKIIDANLVLSAVLINAAVIVANPSSNLFPSHSLSISSSKNSMSITRNAATNMPRGGGGGVFSLPPPTSLAMVGSTVVAVDGIMSVFFPRTAGSSVNVDVDEGTIEHFLMVGGVGACALAIAVTSFSAVGGIASSADAIAYGSVSTFLVYVKFWYGGDVADRIGANSAVMNVMFSLFLSGSLLALTETVDTVRIFRLLTALLVTLSALHYFFPGLLKITFNLDLEKDGQKTKLLYKEACAYAVANGILQGSLAWGYEPSKAVGHMLLTMMLFDTDLLLFQKASSVFGLNRTQTVSMYLLGPLLMAILSYGIFK